MATVREKYNRLQEGKINKQQFLEFVRKDPAIKGIISPVQSFKDVVRVLSSRNIITEDLSNRLDKAFRSAMAEIEEKHIDDSQSIEDVCGKWSEFYDLDLSDYQSLLQRIDNSISGKGSDYELSEDINDDIPKDEYDYFTDEITDILRNKGLDEDDIETIFMSYPKIIKGGYDIGSSPHEVIKTVLRLGHDFNDIDNDTMNQPDIGNYSLNELLQENFDYLKLDKENLNPNSFTGGWRYEYKNQKVKDIDKAKTVAEKNLLKDPLYYINLLSDLKPVKKRTDLPVEVDKKMSNTTDKLNATKINTPNAKASAAKANKETQKIPKYKEDTFKAQRAKGIKGVFDMPGKEKTVRLSEIQNIAKVIAEELKKSFKK